MVKYAKNCVEHVAECEAFRGVSGLSLPTVMRKATAILLLMVFLFEGGGYFVYFTLERAAAQREMAAFMKRLKSEDNLIRIEWNAGNAAEFNWKHEREFRYHGVMYDVVKAVYGYNGEVIYWVHRDKKESELYCALRRLADKDHPDNDLPGLFIRLTLSLIEDTLQLRELPEMIGRTENCREVHLMSEFHGNLPLVPPDVC